MRTLRDVQSSRDRRRESGAALFVAVLMLALMGALGVAALDAVSSDRQIAGMQNRAKSAFYAAEAGASHGRSLVRTVGARTDTPALPTQVAPQTLGDAALYDRENRLPRYYADPAAVPPVRWVRDGGLYSNGGNLQLKGQKFVNTLWQINVIGESPDGSRSRVEVVESKVLSAGYGAAL